MKLQKAVALRISNLILKSGLTRYAFCKQNGIEEQTVKHIIDERNKDIKLKTLTQIAYACNLSLKEFFDDSLFDKNSLDFM